MELKKRSEGTKKRLEEIKMILISSSVFNSSSLLLTFTNYTIYHMKILYSLLFLFISIQLVAQSTNYVANVANSVEPSTENVLVGHDAGYTIPARGYTFLGFGNTFVGTRAGYSSTWGIYNSFFGNKAGYSNTTGFYNIALGYYAGYSNTIGNTNIAIGVYAGYAGKTGGHNVMIGDSAGLNNLQSGNLFVGSKAGFANTTGYSNSFLGNNTGFSNTTGAFNTFLGEVAGRENTTGMANTFLGYQSGYSNTTGQSNVFIGHQAGYNNTTGIGNLFMGNQAGSNNNGSYNLFIGNGSGGGNTIGVGNTSIGDGAFINSTTGGNNTSIGRYAGINNTTGSNNTFIGVAATNPVGSGTLTNSTAIGYNASVTASNAMILGNTSVNVGIGNSAPGNKLEITKGSSNQSGLRFTNLTSASPATAFNQYKFLTVDANGDVVIGSVNSTAREGVAESFWQRTGKYLQSSKDDAVIIGSKVSQTPTGYKLFVEDGILTEKVKVAVKNTSEWSDYVFDNAYQLKELSEVEKFIQTNKHLPGVPSAGEVVEKGIDVAKMDAKLLEKIEELTLYSIQIEKEAKAEKQKNQQLRAEMDELKQLVKQLLDKK
ncbi:hypothetical protein GCM10028807_23200 [Spirosoma daeguense]